MHNDLNVILQDQLNFKLATFQTGERNERHNKKTTTGHVRSIAVNSVRFVFEE